MNLKPLVCAGLIALAVSSCGNAEPQGKLISEVYIVQSGDGLDEISYKFMQKSSVRRDVREFREGIIESNWNEIFKDRYPHGLIKAGDKLVINYWTDK